MAKSNLDAAMSIFFSYININCTKLDATQNGTEQEKEKVDDSYANDERMYPEFKNITNPKQIYRDLLKCFEQWILPAHGTGHVQFSLFYFINTNPEFADQYLKWLWSKFTSPNTPQILRQAAMAYIASFVSRAVCINRAILMSWLKKVRHHRNWVSFVSIEIKKIDF